MLHRSLLPVAAGLLLAALPLAAAEKPLRIDSSESRIDVVVKATVDSFTGHLSAYDPVITVADDGRITAARLGFHFMDLLTGKPKRDRAMHEWQHTPEFPGGEFVLTALTPEPDGRTRATGRLTLHGVTCELNFPVSLTKQDSVYAIDGDAAVDVREFGLPVIKMFGLLKVDPVVHVKFHLQGRVSDES